MRYSILGFSQKKVCTITKEVLVDNKRKTYKLDMSDLIILQDIADFMNRKSIIKYTINEKVYFSITHKAILTDLPILDIKKQALKDRIDKMCLLGIIEKQVVRNDNGTWIGYRLTDVYESLVYENNNDIEGVYQTTRGGCSELHEGGVVNYNPNNYTTIKETTINKKEKDISFSKSDNELFEKCWLAYDRKGQKKEALKCWKKLSDDDKEKIVKHIPFYVKSNERQYLKDFERYIKHRVFESVVTDKRTGNILYDPDRESGAIGYTPILGGALQWNEPNQCYIHIGMYYGYISDGYTDDNRPNGAKVMLGNGQGTVVWSSETKTWNKVQS